MTDDSFPTAAFAAWERKHAAKLDVFVAGLRLEEAEQSGDAEGIAVAKVSRYFAQQHLYGAIRSGDVDRIAAADEGLQQASASYEAAVAARRMPGPKGRWDSEQRYW